MRGVVGLQDTVILREKGYNTKRKQSHKSYNIKYMRNCMRKIEQWKPIKNACGRNYFNSQITFRDVVF